MELHVVCYRHPFRPSRITHTIELSMGVVASVCFASMLQVEITTAPML